MSQLQEVEKLLLEVVMDKKIRLKTTKDSYRVTG